MDPDRPVPVSPVTAVAHPWDGFLSGPENDLAYASVMALARGEDTGLSPLVVHGPSGVGKSRLLAGLVSERLLPPPGPPVGPVGPHAVAAAPPRAGGAARG